MPFYWKHPDENLAVWKIEETPEELLSLSGFSDKYIREILSEIPASESRKLEWISVRLLLKILTKRECLVKYTPNGAPYIPDSTYNISISHTKGYAAVLVRNEGKAGIDLEYLSGRIKKIRSRFLSEEEERIIAHSEDERLLLIHWCAKESVFKLINQTDVDFQKHLHVQPFAYPAECGTFSAYESKSPQQLSFSFTYRFFPEFILVWNNP